ncbi:MAG: hypothetical protein PSU94_01825 [Lacunisphaera sp.]|nr:hypothetical protein [Lacunisphaera sp.]
MNQRTWELGDICEIFLQAEGRPDYFELHITPENNRLQLHWPPDGLARFRGEQARLEDFTISQPDWVESSTEAGPEYWVAHAKITFDRLGIDPLAHPPALRTAVCRYDYGPNPTPVLSSTAPLREPNYHRTQEWQLLKLLPAGEARAGQQKSNGST